MWRYCANRLHPAPTRKPRKTSRATRTRLRSEAKPRTSSIRRQHVNRTEPSRAANSDLLKFGLIRYRARRVRGKQSSRRVRTKACSATHRERPRGATRCIDAGGSTAPPALSSLEAARSRSNCVHARPGFEQWDAINASFIVSTFSRSRPPSRSLQPRVGASTSTSTSTDVESISLAPNKRIFRSSVLLFIPLGSTPTAYTTFVRTPRATTRAQCIDYATRVLGWCRPSE